MNALIKLWTDHGTKLLGLAQLVVASAVATSGLLTGRSVVLAGFINLVLSGMTIKRGFDNSKVNASQTPNE